ncbi:MAG: DUF2339 domain-containing protein [Rhodobacteraceae bacterium]|nr:DUF2339 domain-containing protein [Paracoccaceae bacterium]
MDEFVFFGILFLVVVFGLPIYLLVALSRLKARMSVLEASLATQAPKPAIAPPTVTDDLPKEAPAEQPPAAAPPPKPATAWQPAPKVKPKRNSFVFSGEKIAKASKWAQDNWVFILAGVSLALAGVFLVQYGVENGLLSPRMRVLAAIALGAALIGGGEFIRRKFGHDETGSFALLPSVFAGAGLVAIFSGVLSARMLYGLIGSETAFVGLALTGALAIVLGWVYGPLLAALGVFGALAAPFLVGGSSNTAGPLHLYFAIIAGVALAIDAYKRWAWLSALALIGAFGASWLLLAERDTGFHAMFFAFITALMAVAIPPLSLTPRHTGARLSSFLGNTLKSSSPAFPTRVASGTFLAATGYIGLIYSQDASLFWLALMAAALLLLAAIFWMKDAPALADLAFTPPLLALGIIAYEAMHVRPVALAWIKNANRDVLDTPSMTVALLLAGAIAASLAFAWRSAFRPPLKVANTVLAAGFAPWVAIIIEMRWAPSHVLGAGQWAIYLAIIAAILVVLTERFARLDSEEDRTRTALFALSAMSMISFVAVVLLGGVALTLSFAVMVLAAAWLGDRFKLDLLDWYIQIGAVLVSFRLVVYPGLLWAYEAPLWEVNSAFLGTITLLATAWWFKRGGRAAVVVVLESAIWTLSGIFASLLLARWMSAMGSDELAYVLVSFGGLVWLMLAANQLYRLKAGGRLRGLRIVLAGLYGLAGVFAMAVTVAANPAVWSELRVIGWPIFGSLGAAYLLPAILLGLVGWRFTHLHRGLRVLLWVLAAGLGALWVALEIRHFWRGDDMASYFTSKPELYSYTVAMILAALGLLGLAFIRQSAGLRKLALVMVLLVVAKVYFVDASGLDGLLRVVSFLVLGLVAALMAWVNRLLKTNEANAIAAAMPAPEPEE